jgi:hypothetical protein
VLDWSISSVKGLLTSLHHRDSKAVDRAAPVVYQILLHHSVWPFKPENATNLTLQGLAIAVALLTGADRFCIDVQEPSLEPAIHERPRDWTYRCRLLFQSLCSTSDWTSGSIDSYREEGDDEDLVAVLYGCMPERQKQGRKRFLPVASMLPSSYSQRLDTKAPAQAIEALLELLLSLAVVDKAHRADDEAQDETYDLSTSLAKWTLTSDTTIDWKQFSELVEVTMVILFPPLLLTVIRR